MHWTPAAQQAASHALVQTARDPATTLYLPVPGALRVLFRRYESPVGGWAVRDGPGFSGRFLPARLSFSARGILISGADRTKAPGACRWCVNRLAGERGAMQEKIGRASCR